MRVLAIIVSYNFEPWMERCLGSLQASEYPVDVVVVDNYSSDRTVELIERSYPWVRLLQNGKNLGFGRANNIAMDIALREGYDAVFLVNQDAWVMPAALGALVAAAEKNPSCGIISPVHLAGDGENLDFGFAHYAGVGDVQQLPVAELVTVPFVNAAFWLVPIAVLKKVGGFSSLFYHYGEDIDFVNRLRFHKLKVAYVPAARACHDRENRAVTHAAFLRSEYVFHLSECANINYTLPRAVAYGLLAVVKKSLVQLCRGNFGLSKDYFAMFVRLVARWGGIARCRKQCMIVAPNFLG